MKKKTLIIIGIVLIAVLGYVIYMSVAPKIMTPGEKTPAKPAPVILTEEDKLKILQGLSADQESSSDADKSAAEKKAILEQLSASSNGTSTKNTEQTGPSEEEKMRILKSLGQ